MSTIRKTISISRKDPILQEVIKNVGSYEVSHVIRQLMYDGLKYRSLVEKGVINDESIAILPQKALNIEQKGLINEENEQKGLINEENEQKTVKNNENKQINDDFNEFDEDFGINSIELEEIDENDEDLEDLLLNNG